MSMLSIARSALAQRGALRKARRLAYARAQASQGLVRNPLVWAFGLLLIAFAAAWDEKVMRPANWLQATQAQ